MLIGNQLRKDLTDWLSPPDPFIDFNTADHARHEGTAEWFTQSSVFRNWKESSSFLWIHGKRTSSSHLCALAFVNRSLYSQRALGNLFSRASSINSFWPRGLTDALDHRPSTSSAIIQDIRSVMRAPYYLLSLSNSAINLMISTTFSFAFIQITTAARNNPASVRLLNASRTC
jgi:hypothetical protein